MYVRSSNFSNLEKDGRDCLKSIRKKRKTCWLETEDMDSGFKSGANRMSWFRLLFSRVQYNYTAIKHALETWLALIQPVKFQRSAAALRQRDTATSQDNRLFVSDYHRYISSCRPQVVYRANGPANKPIVDQNERGEISMTLLRQNCAPREVFISSSYFSSTKGLWMAANGTSTL